MESLFVGVSTLTSQNMELRGKVAKAIEATGIDVSDKLLDKAE